jgi:hypothetical protein
LDAVIAFMKPHLVALGIEEPNRFWEHMVDLTDPPANHQLPDSAVEATRTPTISKKLHSRRRH